MTLLFLLATALAVSTALFLYSFLAWAAYGTHRLRPFAALAAFTLCCAILTLTL